MDLRLEQGSSSSVEAWQYLVFVDGVYLGTWRRFFGYLGISANHVGHHATCGLGEVSFGASLAGLHGPVLLNGQLIRGRAGEVPAVIHLGYDRPGHFILRNVTVWLFTPW